MSQIIKWAIALIFCSFALVNLNDPDGFVWVFIYLAIAFLPLAKRVGALYLKIGAVVLFIIGCLITFGILNSLMPWQVDNRMMNLWEHQREGLGLILGAAWLWFGHLLK